MLEIDDFKDAIIQLNTKRAKEIRLYCKNLECSIFQFAHDTTETMKNEIKIS